MKSEFIIHLAEAINREPVFVANIDQKQADKYVKRLSEYNCIAEATIYSGGRVFSLEFDENGREVSKSSMGYVFNLKTL